MNIEKLRETENLSKLKSLVVRISENPYYMVFFVIISFVVAFLSIQNIKIEQMGADPLFIFNITPITYWVAIIAILVLIFGMMPHLHDKRFIIIFVFSSILLLWAFRMIFPLIFTSIPTYEPDAVRYISTLNSWGFSGLDLGTESSYEHNYPLSFLIAYIFLKLGIPTGVFFKVAPFIVYALIMVILYFLTNEIVLNKKCAALSAFLFSISSLGYWVTVHYCPDLIGSLFYLLTLFLCIKFAKKGIWDIKSFLPVLLCIFALILSHHLSTLYLIITLLGLSVVTWYFKPPQIRGKALSFFIIAIFCYTLWVVYGEIVYPDFFNVYVYFSGFGSISEMSQNAGIINNLTFAVYPLFILALFFPKFLKMLHLHHLRELLKPLEKLKDIKEKEFMNLSFIYVCGFVFIFILFISGFVAPVVMAARILEILCFAAYPISSQVLLDFRLAKSSKKRILLFLVLLFVLIIGIYRYYSQIQRRVILE